MAPKYPVNLRKLDYSPLTNPFLEPTTVQIKANAKRRYVRTGSGQELVDPETGEVKAVAMIHSVEEKDDEGFVKVFAEGVKAAFGLERAGARVFQSILEAYQKEKMTGGYVAYLTLMWFDGGLNGEAIGMSEFTFQRGLKELLAKNFLTPKMPNQFWVNPALFFKGDRVAFVKEYRRREPTATIPHQKAASPLPPPTQADQASTIAAQMIETIGREVLDDDVKAGSQRLPVPPGTDEEVTGQIDIEEFTGSPPQPAR